jgi:hypothetical protein
MGKGLGKAISGAVAAIGTVEQPEEERPSLRGAKLRTERAAEHIRELEAVRANARNDAAVRITVPKDAVGSSGAQPMFDWSRSRRPPTWWIAIIAGETVYNLRAALDYLVFALALLDSGNATPRTQFVIADSCDCR